MDLDAYQRRMLELINQYGVAIQGVGGDTPEPPFQHTVGLAAYDHPEFIIFGVPMQIGQPILNDIASIVLGGWMTFSHGDIVERLVRGFSVRLVEVADTRGYLRMSNRIYATSADSPISALQITFPDPQGRWPWEASYGLAGLPLLGPVPRDAEGTRKVLPGRD